MPGDTLSGGSHVLRALALAAAAGVPATLSSTGSQPSAPTPATKPRTQAQAAGSVRVRIVHFSTPDGSPATALDSLSLPPATTAAQLLSLASPLLKLTLGSLGGDNDGGDSDGGADPESSDPCARGAEWWRGVLEREERLRLSPEVRWFCFCELVSWGTTFHSRSTQQPGWLVGAERLTRLRSRI